MFESGATGVDAPPASGTFWTEALVSPDPVDVRGIRCDVDGTAPRCEARHGAAPDGHFQYGPVAERVVGAFIALVGKIDVRRVYREASRRQRRGERDRRAAENRHSPDGSHCRRLALRLAPVDIRRVHRNGPCCSARHERDRRSAADGHLHDRSSWSIPVAIVRPVNARLVDRYGTRGILAGGERRQRTPTVDRHRHDGALAYRAAPRVDPVRLRCADRETVRAGLPGREHSRYVGPCGVCVNSGRVGADFASAAPVDRRQDQQSERRFPHGACPRPVRRTGQLWPTDARAEPRVRRSSIGVFIHSRSPRKKPEPIAQVAGHLKDPQGPSPPTLASPRRASTNRVGASRDEQR